MTCENQKYSIFVLIRFDNNKLTITMQDSAKRVPLPAAVFNRTPNKERGPSPNAKLFSVVTPTRSRCVSPSMSSSRRTVDERNKQNSMMSGSKDVKEACVNHQNKEGSYAVVGENGMYCQKCAILLASQGFKVNKTGRTTHQRRMETEELNSLADQTLRTLGTKQVEISQCQVHCQETYQEQIAITQEYFCQLHKIVDYYRAQTLQCIEGEFMRSQNIQDQLKQIVQESLSETSKIKTILKQKEFTIDDSQFTILVEDCKFKLNRYKDTTKLWRAEDVVVRPISLCDINHLASILDGLYHTSKVLFDQCQSEPKASSRTNMLIDTDIIEEEETITEDDIQQ